LPNPRLTFSPSAGRGWVGGFEQMVSLHIFDMDGTLLPGSACLELSRRMGKLNAASEMEERWAAGEITHLRYWELLLSLWEGMSEEDMDEAFDAVAWVDGIPDVWGDIERRGEKSAVITQSPQFFADRLLPWGAGSAHGARVEVGGVPDPALVVTPQSKLEVAQELMQRYGLTEEQCVAYGDSTSDVPLFEHLTNTVAVNGTGVLRGIAARSYEGSDLREAYALGRALLDRAPANSEPS